MSDTDATVTSAPPSVEAGVGGESAVEAPPAAPPQSSDPSDKPPSKAASDKKTVAKPGVASKTASTSTTAKKPAASSVASTSSATRSTSSPKPAAGSVASSSVAKKPVPSSTNGSSTLAAKKPASAAVAASSAPVKKAVSSPSMASSTRPSTSASTGAAKIVRPPSSTSTAPTIKTAASSLGTKKAAEKSVPATTSAELTEKIRDLEAQLSAHNNANEAESNAKISTLEATLAEKEQIIGALNAKVVELASAAQETAEAALLEKQGLEIKLASIIKDKDQTIESLRSHIESQVNGLHAEVAKSKAVYTETVANHEEEKAELLKKLAAHEETIAGCKVGLQMAEAETAKLRQALQNYEDELKAAKDVVSQREADLNSALQNHSAGLAAREEELSYARDAVASARTRILDLEKQLQDKSEALQIAKEELESALSAPAKTVQDPVLIERVRELEESVSNYLAEIESIKAAKEADVIKLTEETGILKVQLKAALDVRDNVVAEIEAIRSKATANSTDVSEAIQARDEAIKRAEEVSAELAIKTEELEKLREPAAQSERIPGLEAQLASITAELEALRADAVESAERAERSVALEAELSSTLLEVDQLREEKAELGRTIDQITTELGSKHTEVDQLRASISASEESLTEKTRALEELENELLAVKSASGEANAAGHVAELQNQLAEANEKGSRADELIQKVSSLETQIAELQSASALRLVEVNEEKSAQIATLTAEVEQLRSDLAAAAAANTETADLVSQVKVLKEALDASQSSNRLLQETTNDYEDREQALNENIKHLKSQLDAVTTAPADNGKVAELEAVVSDLNTKIQQLQVSRQESSDEINVVSREEYEEVRAARDMLAVQNEELMNHIESLLPSDSDGQPATFPEKDQTNRALLLRLKLQKFINSTADGSSPMVEE